jgi:NADP-dependent 3-hydroxy acid dehydrogenase YdfG
MREQLQVMQVDLCDTHSVSRFAKDFQARYRRLDILVNNGMTILKHLIIK